MKRQRITVGSILEINIDNEYYVYAQILGHACCAFFDFRSTKRLNDFLLLLDARVLFVIAVYNDAVNQGHWLKVSKMEIGSDLNILPMAFIEDPFKYNSYELYNPNTGEITPAKKEDCIGLERAAVWEPEHVESRIRDYYNGISNIYVEEMKLK